MIRAFLLAVALAAGASLVMAHGTGKEKAHHGGQVVTAGHDHLELVAKDGELDLRSEDWSAGAADLEDRAGKGPCPAR